MGANINTSQKPKGLLNFILRLFKKSENIAEEKKKSNRLEPKYWPEVIEFIERIEKTIQSHTIDDENIKIVNQRIIDYICEQINIKGSIENMEERYTALDTLVDRILIKNLGKIVGLKHNESTHAEFSEIVSAFKVKLHQRHQAEIAHTLRQ